ncbi:hypothetical protein L1887_02473 [Cichorium endivia]|nr:hypothetical protein L1887_02473 [Cichorium endivia]
MKFLFFLCYIIKHFVILGSFCLNYVSATRFLEFTKVHLRSSFMFIGTFVRSCYSNSQQKTLTIDIIGLTNDLTLALTTICG